MDQSILVGDIGSTKSTWWFWDKTPHQLQLSGYNPISHSDTVRDALFKTLRHQTGRISFSSVWYYGAGVIDQSLGQTIRSVLQELFPESKIHVHSDLAGACLAACGSTPGTVAILGTGSHAAIWNGHEISRQANSLGYILGDEGGGCDIGKALIQAYFYHEMPDPIRMVMDEKITNGRKGFLAELQASDAPNQFLADFARVAVLFKEHPWINSLVASRFELFVRRHLLPLEPKGEIHVVGSIGCIFAGLITRELIRHGFTAGDFIKDPAHRLFERHYEHGKE